MRAAQVAQKKMKKFIVGVISLESVSRILSYNSNGRDGARWRQTRKLSAHYSIVNL